MHEVRNVFIILARKPERKRPHHRNRHRGHDNIEMGLTKTGGGSGLDLRGSGQGPVIDQIPQSSVYNMTSY
jgi:hypothetical protein